MPVHEADMKRLGLRPRKRLPWWAIAGSSTGALALFTGGAYLGYRIWPQPRQTRAARLRGHIGL